MHRLTLFILLLLTPFASAQQLSPWQGEWGTVTATNPKAPDVQRLDISDCHDLSCTFAISIKDSAYRCETSTKATLTLSGNDATSTLPGPDATHACSLNFHRDGFSITVAATGHACHSYYCTDPTYNKLSFNHTFTLRSPQFWFGQHVEECFYRNSPARMATCTDATLARLEDNWRSLYNHFPLDGNASDNGYQHVLAIDDTLLNQCDTAPNPADCLRTRFIADIATMQADKSAEINASTERGDPATARALALKIAGRYRHRFANGDVQGEHFTSTDTMTLTPVGAASIHFDIELNFYNGHTCSVSGGALYRKDGTFVFDDVPANAIPPEQACRLALVPTARGVDIKDLGGCKMSYCGARGGFNGAGFSFTDRRP